MDVEGDSRLCAPSGRQQRKAAWHHEDNQSTCIPKNAVNHFSKASSKRVHRNVTSAKRTRTSLPQAKLSAHEGYQTSHLVTAFRPWGALRPERDQDASSKAASHGKRCPRAGWQQHRSSCYTMGSGRLHHHNPSRETDVNSGL